MNDEHHAGRICTLLVRYGKLAAEFEDTDDPARREVLRARLAELDGVLDRLNTRGCESPSAPGGREGDGGRSSATHLGTRWA